MRFIEIAAIAALALGAAACGGGASENVMSPEANALEPAQIDAALGPENATDAELNSVGENSNTLGNGAETDSNAQDAAAGNNSD